MSFEIPLTNDPAQRLEVSLLDTRYFLTVKYNYQGNLWTLSMEASSGVIFENMAMMPGRDMLWPHEDLRIGQLWMIDTTGENLDPDADNLGTTVKLIYYEPGEEPLIPALEEENGSPTIQ